MNKIFIPSILLSLSVTQVQASVISFLGEIHTGNNEFSIYNNSDSGIRIDEVNVTLGGSTVFGNAVLDSTIEIGHFVTADYNVSGVEGDALNSVYNTSALGNEGYVGDLATDVTGGNTATFNFTDFDAGEAWGISVDYDNPFFDDNNPDSEAGGNLLDGTIIEVWFTDGANREMLSFTYDIGGGAGKKSFPTDPAPFNAESTLNAVPVPAAAYLFGSGLLGLVAVSRRRQTL